MYICASMHACASASYSRNNHAEVTASRQERHEKNTAVNSGNDGVKNN